MLFKRGRDISLKPSRIAPLQPQNTRTHSQQNVNSTVASWRLERGQTPSLLSHTQRIRVLECPIHSSLDVITVLFKSNHNLNTKKPNDHFGDRKACGAGMNLELISKRPHLKTRWCAFLWLCRGNVKSSQSGRKTSVVWEKTSPTTKMPNACCDWDMVRTRWNRSPTNWAAKTRVCLLAGLVPISSNNLVKIGSNATVQ